MYCNWKQMKQMIFQVMNFILFSLLLFADFLEYHLLPNIFCFSVYLVFMQFIHEFQFSNNFFGKLLSSLF